VNSGGGNAARVPDHYETLGPESKASPQEIERTYQPELPNLASNDHRDEPRSPCPFASALQHPQSCAATAEAKSLNTLVFAGELVPGGVAQGTYGATLDVPTGSMAM
jgi:hypothetical protein